MSQSSAPDPKLWARLEKWLREHPLETFSYWIEKGAHRVSSSFDPSDGENFDEALRKFLKGVGA